MIELLVLVVALIVGIVVCGVLSLPFIVLGLRSARRTPEGASVRALPWAIGAACLSGFVVGASGFLFGATIGDESAGAIAVMLFGIGGVGGALLGGLLTFAMIVPKARTPSR